MALLSESKRQVVWPHGELEADRDPRLPDGWRDRARAGGRDCFRRSVGALGGLIAGQWIDPAEDAIHRDWTRIFSASPGPWTTGAVCVDAIGGDVTEARKLAAFGGPAKHERLLELKHPWDPDNLFHLNHNVAP